MERIRPGEGGSCLSSAFCLLFQGRREARPLPDSGLWPIARAASLRVQRTLGLIPGTRQGEEGRPGF